MEEEISKEKEEEYFRHRDEVERMKKEALNGDSEAAFSLGLVYLEGKKAPEDRKEAYVFFVKAALMGNKEALDFVFEKAEEGDTEALYSKGILCMDLRLDEEPENIDGYFEKASGENADALGMYGFCLATRSGKENREKGIALLEESAQKGSLVGLRYLAYCNLMGRGCEKNIDRGLKLYGEAIDRGDTESMFRVGKAYSSGLVLFRDEGFAFSLFEKGASLYDRDCLRECGMCYELGEGTDHDTEKAFSCYEKAAALGDTWSISRLGDIYSRGDWVEKDAEKAFLCYKRAYDLGDTQCVFDLASCYEKGEGTKEDPKAAFGIYDALYRKSEGISLIAIAKLIRFYKEGYGTQKDAEKADMLLKELEEKVKEYEPFDEEKEELVRILGPLPFLE